MKPRDFLKTMQQRTAVAAIGPSALRGQGKGVIRATREFLGKIKLGRIPDSSPEAFRRWLDRQTDSLLDVLPIRNRPWGAARKGINLFLRDVLYNRYLCRHYRLRHLEQMLEIPLDRAVAKGLRAEAGETWLPPWPGLKHLTPAASDVFQGCAARQAKAKGIDKAHLDMYLWLANR